MTPPSPTQVAAGLLSRAAIAWMRVRGSRKDAADWEGVLARVSAARARPPVRPTRAMRRRFLIGAETVDGHEAWRLAPRGEARHGELIYIHGGAYLYDLDPLHWRIAADMAGRLGLPVSLPRYPLAPEHDARRALAFLLAIYRMALARAAPGRLIVMGDSAGGGLAVSLVRAALDAGLPRPAGLVLISPWLDAAVRDPSQRFLERIDPMLTVGGLQAAGRLYAGDCSVEDPLVSPIHASLAGFPPVQLFAADQDVLLADARRLAARAAELPVLDYVEGTGLIHVWPNMGFPESRGARARMAAFCTRALADA